MSQNPLYSPRDLGQYRSRNSQEFSDELRVTQHEAFRSPYADGSFYAARAQNIRLTTEGINLLNFRLTELITEEKTQHQTQLNKDNYQNILQRLFEEEGEDFKKVLDALREAGFRPVHKYSYYDNARAEGKVNALLTWLEHKGPTDPIMTLSAYMKAQGLDQVTDHFFSVMTEPMEIGPAQEDLTRYLSTGGGRLPNYILSDTDGGHGAIYLAALQAGHLYLPTEGYPLLARILTREYYAHQRILEGNKLTEKMDIKEITARFNEIDTALLTALSKLNNNKLEYWHSKENVTYKTSKERSHGTLQSDQTHADELFQLATLVKPKLADAVPLRLIGDILHNNLTCNDDATILLMEKLPNVIKYRGDKDAPKASLSEDVFDKGKSRVKQNLPGLKTLVDEFKFFTWENTTFISNYGLTVKPVETQVSSNANSRVAFGLEFTLGTGKVTVEFDKDDVVIKEDSIAFQGNPERVKENVKKARNAIENNLLPNIETFMDGSRDQCYLHGEEHKPTDDQLSICNTLLGIRQICGHSQGFNINKGGDIIRLNSTDANSDDASSIVKAPGLAFVVHQNWPTEGKTRPSKIVLSTSSNLQLIDQVPISQRSMQLWVQGLGSQSSDGQNTRRKSEPFIVEKVQEI